MIRTALFAALLPLAATAAETERLTPQQFEDYVTGKTLMYGFDGQHYGGEDYLPDRKVRWSFLDGRCKSGYWYPSEGDICFVYEDNPDPQCWSFYLRGSTLVAQFENNPEYEELYETGESEEPLQCLGPEVGV
ncbi:hypothetical protein [Maritimibacter sp. UBA3975]|uniref:hypothetical protein n=1 Tax=Maritimibacter sp. UBA3975 TaxID=1946833 RepID=UPI000C0B5C60|nr:hypothetical protein [Maritimibacter sp. UBA3975]MAM62569.1 hypothetical protein [Maritimibacter sp.]|tara:strand:- start:688 stop:1086 length:399 start_codon:yes stop_codon:yes gene_type:complete